MDLARLVRTRREAKGWTQDDLADRLGRDQNFVSSIEIGRTKRPRSENLRQLMQVLDITPDEMAVAVGERALADLGVSFDADVDQDDPYIKLLFSLASRMDEHERDVLTSVARLIVRNRAEAGAA